MFLKKQKLVRGALIPVALADCIVATQHSQARPGMLLFNAFYEIRMNANGASTALSR